MKIVALAGGVGGAKLITGLAQILPKSELTVIVNTGDDFDHFGLRICPDLDTICYSLAGIANIDTGWGLQTETWNALGTIQALGGPTWFRLGDRDLGTHMERTRQLSAGNPLSQVTKNFCRALGIETIILPMTDGRFATYIVTSEDNELPFQEYFVHQQCRPVIKSFRFEGSENCEPAAGVLEAINAAELIVICPSNPWVSIGPILAVQSIKESIRNRPVVAVSPIIGGKTVKGPAAKMYLELGIQPSPDAVAELYKDFLSGLIIDEIDRDQNDIISARGIILYITDILMKNDEDRRRLAGEVLTFGKMLTWR
jgi:LPPG:FO 2-phospho-L-lactate transferase